MPDLTLTQAMIMLGIGAVLMLVGIIRMLAARGRTIITMAMLAVGLPLLLIGGYAAFISSIGHLVG